MARVLVTEKIADKGLELLQEAGHEVDVQLGLDEAGLISAIAGANAIIIRSATTVTAELLAAGTDLKIVGRAGIGLDNVDGRRRYCAERAGGECAVLERHHCGRAHLGHDVGAGPQHCASTFSTG